MATAIRLNTEYGHAQYAILNALLEEHKKLDSEKEFRMMCSNDYVIQQDYLEYFLTNKKMVAKHSLVEEDVEGFKIFNEQSDVCSVLKYFAGS